MSYRIVKGDRLDSSLEDAPTVDILTRPGGNPSEVSIEYASDYDEKSRTRVTFSNVYHYSWTDEFIDRGGDNEEDFEFTPIEIVDSSLLARIVQSSPHFDTPSGEKLGGTLKGSDLHHYRIGFDDHGTYDIVSTGLTIDVRGPSRANGRQ